MHKRCYHARPCSGGPSSSSLCSLALCCFTSSPKSWWLLSSWTSLQNCQATGKCSWLVKSLEVGWEETKSPEHTAHPILSVQFSPTSPLFALPATAHIHNLYNMRSRSAGPLTALPCPVQPAERNCLRMSSCQAACHTCRALELHSEWNEFQEGAIPASWSCRASALCPGSPTHGQHLHTAGRQLKPAVLVRTPG